MNIINAFLSIFGAQPKVDMGNVMCRGFKDENPALKEKRAEAMAKMDTWGRKTLLQNGSYARSNEVLRERQLSMF